jgi:hypothetical protein
MSLNISIKQGLIAKDPVVKDNRLYSTVCVTKSYKDKEGNFQEKESFFDFQLIGENFVNAYKDKIVKGKQISFQGEDQIWYTKDEEKNTTYTNHAIVVTEIHFLKYLPGKKPAEQQAAAAN